jgi:twitching motility protein PilT
MARIDAFIQSIRERGGDRLILLSGTKAVLATGDEMRPVSAQPASLPQVQELLREITPAGSARALTEDGTHEFVYASPAGPALVKVVRGADRLQVEVTPSRASAPETAVAGAAPGGADASKMNDLFLRMVKEKCSDLHLCTGNPPLFRKDGEMVALGRTAPLTNEEAADLLFSITPATHRAEFERTHDADFSYEISGVARFRCNLFLDRNGMGGVFRVIPTQIPTAESLGLPKAALDLCQLLKGLVLVTGPTGSGKSTTLAAMIDHINRTRPAHIITIEDPIEFVHLPKKCVITQRQVGQHSQSFKGALRAALREDPDVILVGEMRDLETVSIAIETAETGHLVFGTLHTTTAASTVDRIIDQFPVDRQGQIRVMLAESLKGVIAQVLCRRIGGGRIAAKEVLLSIPAISNLIREGKTFQIPSIMQTNRKGGMVTLNDALLELVEQKLVEPKEAYLRSTEKSTFAAALKARRFDLSFLEGA